LFPPQIPDEVDLDAALLLDDAREAFNVFDTDGSGTIDHAEFSELVEVRPCMEDTGSSR
jgi:Ca2+-binding EF-hand superfamily protein